jgi:uncharacterized protein
MGDRIEVVDVDVLREVLRRFTTALEIHRDELDSLNVFPVPDGDTGTNLLLTMRGVMESLNEAPAVNFAAAVADGALMAARGNSGVILAQALRALVGGLSGASAAGGAELAGALGAAASELAGALRAAAAEARRAVARPVEGTVLTVLTDAAAAATASAGDGGPVPDVATAALAAAQASLERTTAALPELAEAGVVDAGGLGAVLLLDALASVANGVEMAVGVRDAGPVGRSDSADADQEMGFAFEVMFLLRADDSVIPSLRDALAELGDSLVVIGSGGRYKMHLHTDEPERAVDIAAGVGAPEDVRVVDLSEQVAEQCVAGQARAVRVGERQASELVAVADGAGLEELFRSLGATVVRGGPFLVEEVVRVIDAAAAEAVIVLPNDPAAIPIVERAAGDSSRDVWVVPTRTVAEGLSAAAAFNPTAELVDAVERMSEAAAAVVSAAVSRAAGDASGGIRAGDWVGVVEGEVVAVGEDLASVMLGLVATIRTDDHEILTLLAGADATDEELARLAAGLRAGIAGLMVETHRGDQLGIHFVLGLE